MRRWFATSLLFCLAGVGGIALTEQRSAKPDLVVDLKFAPQENVGRKSAALPPSMLDRPVRMQIEDARKQTEPRRLGEGTDDDDRVFQILSATDVAPFVTAVVARLAESQGVLESDSAASQLQLRISRFMVSEANKPVGSMYTAEVHLGFVFRNTPGGTAVEGAASGTANRYGRARSAANCAEVISDALKEAFVNLLGDVRLQAAWKSAGAIAGRGPVARH